MKSLKFDLSLLITSICFAFIVLTLQTNFAAGKTKAKLEDICWIFQHQPNWKRSAYKASNRWKIPVNILMATIYQESRFRSNVKAKTSSAYGFAQAVDSIWAQYKKSRHIPHANRRNFNDSIDFIGWYFDKVIKRYKVSPHNTQQLYLYYQLGLYHRHAPVSSKKIASKVAHLATQYRKQLDQC
ncbi:transglycosylase [Piscirickettsia litoralis]|uniref:Transglycosylase n=1 Tax=Piscirickettsia litoralis TaxID=1891921 RepID=A0ABX3ACQ7_9GAMM|nr:transglycosylase [Piscirickettsia litoralis]